MGLLSLKDDILLLIIDIIEPDDLVNFVLANKYIHALSSKRLIQHRYFVKNYSELAIACEADEIGPKALHNVEHAVNLLTMMDDEPRLAQYIRVLYVCTRLGDDDSRDDVLRDRAAKIVEERECFKNMTQGLNLIADNSSDIETDLARGSTGMTSALVLFQACNLVRLHFGNTSHPNIFHHLRTLVEATEPDQVKNDRELQKPARSALFPYLETISSTSWSVARAVLALFAKPVTPSTWFCEDEPDDDNHGFARKLFPLPSPLRRLDFRNLHRCTWFLETDGTNVRPWTWRLIWEQVDTLTCLEAVLLPILPINAIQIFELIEALNNLKYFSVDVQGEAFLHTGDAISEHWPAEIVLRNLHKAAASLLERRGLVAEIQEGEYDTLVVRKAAPDEVHEKPKILFTLDQTR